jgi:uncharacterized membrane protein
MTESPFEWNQGGTGGKYRPRLDIPRAQVEVFVELAAAVVILCAIAYLGAAWPSLPSRIPVHFNISGQPDRWGDRSSLLLEFAIMLGVYIGLTVLQRFPHIYNYPFGLTLQNVHRQYLLARQLLVFIKGEVVCIFAFIGWRTVQVAMGKSRFPAAGFPLVMILCLFGTIVWYFVRASRAR